MSIVLTNLLIMVSYTLLFRLSGRDGIYQGALLLALHIICCLIIAPFASGKAFLLSALTLLLLGFSTCYLAYGVGKS